MVALVPKPKRIPNPRGRPRTEQHVVRLARKHTERAISLLVKVIEDDAAPVAARVTAAQAVLDRGWGKPRQEVEGRHSIQVNLGQQHLDAIRALSQAVGKTRALEHPKSKVIDAEAVEVTDESRDAAKLVYAAKQQAAE
jgi:hypothetical protein